MSCSSFDSSARYACSLSAPLFTETGGTEWWCRTGRELHEAMLPPFAFTPRLHCISDLEVACAGVSSKGRFRTIANPRQDTELFHT